MATAYSGSGAAPGLVRRREELSLMLQAEKNRLEGVASNVRSSLERIIATLERREGTLGKAHHPADPISPATLLRSSTALHHQRNRLAHGRHPAWPRWHGPVKSSAHGRLPLMLVWLHAGKKWHLRASQQRPGKEGNRYLRKALYMPALVAIKYNAPLKPLRFPASQPLANPK